jgi:phenylalanyl-tRNA synthetase alpha chain
VQQLIDQTREQFLRDLNHVKSSADLEGVKTKFLCRKGPIQDFMKGLKDVESDQRPAVGKLINDLKVFISGQCDEQEIKLIAIEENNQLATESIDITLPGRHSRIGRKHPLTQAMDHIIEILMGMGFSYQGGPEIDSDYNNFEVLNFAEDHPARDMHDTFFIDDHTLLRTHTSNIQARVMEMSKPPIRIIAPGKAYRNETVTARSHVFFHQIEAVYIDKHVTFADLFATLSEFLQKLFKEKIEIRNRPSYFPFVEPGLEVDVTCLVCEGKGCPVCKHSGWLEIAGAGMIHPQVLINGGIDPEVYSGFAWGMGLERLVMILKRINDIRLFTENDLRFLNQFTIL